MVAETRPAAVGVILAGGRGRRMGGADKGLLEWRGRPLVVHVAERLRPQVDGLLVVANRNQDRYRELGFDVIADGEFRGEGPLAGMLAAMRHVSTERILAVPCDAPVLPGDLGARLMQGMGAAPAALAHDGERAQQLFVVLRTTLADVVHDFLAGGGRAVHEFLAAVGAVPVDFSDQPAAFANINTPGQLGL